MLYNLILIPLYPIIGLYLMQRYVSEKSKPGWKQRWGNLPEELRRRPGSRPRIWIHAVSAGEVVAAAPILRELREPASDFEILFSVVTPAGFEMAQQQVAPLADAIFYFPFDFPWVARKVARFLSPDVFVSLESELWPNILHELKRGGAKTVMVNGRISEKNFRRASRFGGFFFRWMLGNMDALLMQSQADAERIGALGERLEETGRVRVIGNSKFDQSARALSEEETLRLRRDLKLPEGAPVFVAGSARSKEEEAQIIQAYRAMRERVPDLCLILAPRHIERASEISAAMREAGLSPVRRTKLGESVGPARHLILDTLGELANVYAVGTIAFTGNSFEPVVKGGGQNLLQPLAQGKPVFVGPRTATIRAEIALAMEAGVGFQVADGEALAREGLRLLQDEKALCEIERRALELIRTNRGASRRYATAVADMANAPLVEREGASPHLEGGSKGLEAYLISVSRGRKGLIPILLRFVMSALAIVYVVGLKLYLAPYHLGIRRRARLPAFVVCVGNLTAGGTGKTPMTQTLCRMLQAQGLKVVVLSRGYGGRFEKSCAVASDGKRVRLSAKEAGDEAHMLARTLPGVPVVVGKDRRATGRLACRQFEPDVVVMDDGMQFWQLHRDLDIVLVNARRPFDNGWTFPRGLLREPISHLRRAGVIVLTNVRQAGEERVSRVKSMARRIAPNRPVFAADLAPIGWKPLGSDEEYAPDWLSERRVAALSAVGNPASFETMLGELGGILSARYRFRDHHGVTLEEMERVMAGACATGAEAVVTTEKDAVKLTPFKSGLPILALQVAMRVEGETDFLTTIWEMILENRRKLDGGTPKL